MHFRAISYDQVTDLVERAKRGDEEAGAVLRVLSTCRDTECISCNDEFTRSNKIGGFIVGSRATRQVHSSASAPFASGACVLPAVLSSLSAM